MIERKKPKFVRRQGTMFIRLKKRSARKWLRPRGRDNKVRLKFNGVARKAEIGWGRKKEDKGKVDGAYLIKISNITSLKGLNRGQGILLANLGKKKRMEIIKIANEMGLVIKNRYTGRKNNATN